MRRTSVMDNTIASEEGNRENAVTDQRISCELLSKSLPLRCPLFVSAGGEASTHTVWRRFLPCQLGLRQVPFINKASVVLIALRRQNLHCPRDHDDHSRQGDSDDVRHGYSVLCHDVNPRSRERKCARRCKARLGSFQSDGIKPRTRGEGVQGVAEHGRSAQCALARKVCMVWQATVISHSVVGSSPDLERSNVQGVAGQVRSAQCFTVKPQPREKCVCVCVQSVARRAILCVQ